jgi:isoquinoline 1-oxidoreductase subunit alpha
MEAEATFTLSINGQNHTVDVPPDMPLLWLLRDVVGLTGTKFGCGIAQCGACTVHLAGQAVRSCVLPISTVGDKPIITIEAVGETMPDRPDQRRR